MTADSSAISIAPNATQREHIVQRLCTHFASNHLTMEELEERIDRAYKAPSLAELETLVTGLPVMADDAPLPSSSATPIAHTDVSVVDVPARDVLIGIMSGHMRRGRWLVPRHLKVFTVMGGVELDLREAVLAPGVSEIEITALMAGVTVIIPPDVRVECVGSAFMGAFEVHQSRDTVVTATGDRVVRLSGFAVMGGVDGKIRALKNAVKR
ncbi:MAG TPA: DUF1707 domain-containing protein [Gemmatimonadaceae bacterium]|jgi:hypothetical protein